MNLNAVITGKEEFSPGNFVLRISPEDFHVPDFKAGQYCVIGLPSSNESAAKFIKRAYSIASTSFEKNYIELYITVVPTGELTPKLYELKLGDRIWLSPRVVGHFTLDKSDENKNLVLIATGTGLAPYMSMLRTLVKMKKLNRHITIIHGARNSWELGHKRELEVLADYSDLFHYIPAITRVTDEHGRWDGLTGRINDLWEKKIIQERIPHPISNETSEVYLCGNPQMIESMVQLLKEEGMTEDKKNEKGNVHLERYW